MNVVGKVWGQTSLLYKSPFIEIHKIKIKPNCRCSLHLHTVKNNSFYILSGKLTIEVHKNDYALIDETTLEEGFFTNVKPGEFHRFISGPDGAEVLEIYHPEALSEDIVRKDHGGVMEQDSVDIGRRSESFRSD